MLRARDSTEPIPVVVIGTAAWSAPWLTEQNLAFALAKRHQVLYVEPPQITPRTRGRDGSARLRRVRLHGRELIIFRPVVLPYRSRARWARASAPLYARQIRSVVRRLGFTRAILLAGDARPGVVGAADERLSSYIVKDWIYENADLLGRPAADLVRERDEMCAAVDLVLAISPSLQRSLAEVGISSDLLLHGFHSDLVAEYEREPPAEYLSLPRPRITFAGRIDGRLDVGKLNAVAARFPEGSVILLGPPSVRMDHADLDSLQRAENIHLLGPRGRTELPPYLSHADCLLIPYRDSVWAHHGSPLKLWDYLYAGPPIVGSGYSILDDYRSLLRFANDDAEFVTLVADAIGDGSGAQERRAFALANTWEERGRELEALLGAVLEGAAS